MPEEKTEWNDQMTEFIDITKAYNQLPHKDMYLVGKVIADENLAYVNAHSAQVHPKNTFYTAYGKRALDFLIALAATCVFLPINLLLAVCTYFDVGTPIFFKQTRIGMHGKPFVLVKFRNMNNKTDANGDLLPGKDRVTRFGRFVRKTSLDELLNFLSVLKGDMSIIGPRPLVDGYNERFSERHKYRWAVRPGLECPMMRPVKNLTWSDQFENDIWYVENVSLMTDIKMLFALVRVAFDRKSTAMRGSAVRGSFMGYNRDGSSINSQKVPIEYFNKALARHAIEEEKMDI